MRADQQCISDAGLFQSVCERIFGAEICASRFWAPPPPPTVAELAKEMWDRTTRGQGLVYSHGKPFFDDLALLSLAAATLDNLARELDAEREHSQQLRSQLKKEREWRDAL